MPCRTWVDDAAPVLHRRAMVTTVIRVGESAAITLDTLLLDLSGLSVGDAVRVQWNEDGTLVVTPLRRPPTREELAQSIRRVHPQVPASDEPSCCGVPLGAAEAELGHVRHTELWRSFRL